MNTKLKFAWRLFAATILLLVGVAHAAPPPRLGPAQCTRYTVQPGDNAWTIAQKNKIPWDRFVQLNNYIEDLGQIWPMDELTLSCPAESAPKKVDPIVVTAQPVPTTVATTQVATTVAKVVPITTVATTTAPPKIFEAAVAEYKAPPFECSPAGDGNGKNIVRFDGSEACFAPLSVIVGLLYNSGFRGEALIIMTAISIPESGRDAFIQGDRTLVDSKWGNSIGLFQIRSVNAQLNTGGPRDLNALLDSPQHQADSAWRISSGGTNFTPWTTFTSGAYKRHMSAAEKAMHDAKAG